jgi:2-polyprenyl-3-methyl-5-hydroxy-6-metoxy-1,4-benzoquinol methylase
MSADAPPARCSVCGGSSAGLVYALTRLRIVRCALCGQVFLWPLPSEDDVRRIFAELYAGGDGVMPELRDYYGFTYDDSPSNPLVQLHEAWLDAIERHRAPGRIADVGCGTGLFLAAARRRGWTPFGVDESVEATTYARDHFGLDVWTGEFSTFTRRAEEFDAISMWDILEHARDPIALLEAARSFLAPNGVLALATPNRRSLLELVAAAMYRLSGHRIVAPLEKLYIEQHFLYFDPATLSQALERAGLEVFELRLEPTDLRRLTLSPPLRLALRGLFAVARFTRLENRLFALARRRS